MACPGRSRKPPWARSDGPTAPRPVSGPPSPPSSWPRAPCSPMPKACTRSPWRIGRSRRSAFACGASTTPWRRSARPAGPKTSSPTGGCRCENSEARGGASWGWGASGPRGAGGGPTQLSELAKRSDVLVIAAPDTGATRGVVNDPVLRALPRGAYVVSMARGSLLDEQALLVHLESGQGAGGGLLDEQALLVHLESGQVAGCVLDVYAKEPLPQDHPFWRHPRVLVSPHVSAVSDRFWERETALLVNNIRRYRRGAKLQNLVDLEAGY